MAIKVGGTSVINDSRQLKNIASLDATTAATIQSAITFPTSYAGVGTYTAAGRSYTSGGSGEVSAGGTLSGSSLKKSTGNGHNNFFQVLSNGSTASSGLSGTWRQMTPYQRYSAPDYTNFALWVRIS